MSVLSFKTVKYCSQIPKFSYYFRTSSTSTGISKDAVTHSAARPDTWSQFYDRPVNEPIECTSVLLFPGQGSQFVGMGKNLIDVPGVKVMYEEASSILRTDLLKICLEGPPEKLQKTIHCQPAIYVTSLAAVKKLHTESPNLIEKCVAAAGYSVGEISALVFAGSYKFEEGLHLIKVRAEEMQRASDLINGGMCSVMLDHDSQLRPAITAAIHHCTEELKIKTPVACQVASYLGSSCKIVAGNIETIEFIETNASHFRLRRVQRLPVCGAFHTSLMSPATAAMKKKLANLPAPRTPSIPVISNVDAEPYAQGAAIPRQLVKQLTQPICWEQTMHALYDRPPDSLFPVTVEVGPGRQLGTIVRLVNEKAFANYQSIEV